MSNIYRYFIILILLSNCSLDTKSGIWTKEKNIVLEKDNRTNVFANQKQLSNEFNSNLEIKLSTKLTSNSFANELTNNNNRVNYNGELKKISKFKFSKIHNFDYYEPELIFEKDNLIFFDNKGSIIKFDPNSKIIWKKNYYKKEEKKIKPILIFGKDLDKLIVADNISKYYALDIKTGDLLWSKYHSSPFNSKIKVYKDKFFVIDFNNVLRCFSTKDGKELWNVKASNTFIKSDKKLSIVVVGNALYFSNSTGDITAVDIENGNMLWQIPTQNSTIYENTFLLKTSKIVSNNKILIFSNNNNEFYSINLKTGSLNWKQNVNSSLQSSIINDLIFSITNEGYLVIIDSKEGKIIRITNIFNLIKKKKRKKIQPVGFIVAKKNIYLTTDHGRLLVIDITSGKTKTILKIDNNKISKPFIINENLFLIKEDSIIRLN